MSKSEKLQQYIDMIQFFYDSIDDYIFIYDLTSERVFLTDKIREKFPIPPAGEDGNDFRNWNDIVYPKDRALMDHYRELLFKREIRSFDIAYRILDREGNKVWVRVRGALQEMDDVQTVLIVGRVSEITSEVQVDAMTGLRGTEKFVRDMKQNLTTSDGYLMILDIDNFHNINIIQGKESGGAVLKRVASTLDEYTNYPMELYCLDRDCFAVNFIEKQKSDVETFYHTIRKALEDVCTISAGAVSYQHGNTGDSGAVYLYAQAALDEAKKKKKGELVFFSADAYQKNMQQVELLAEIKSSIQEGFKGFRVVYQPQISGQNFSICGVEALLRYDSPSRGSISPVEFIPLLEQTMLICPVGEWVLETALSQCRQWRKHIPNLHMSVNLSYLQLQQDSVTDMVLDHLKKAQLPGEALTLELTESIQLQNYHHFNTIFHIWKQSGIRISIDDFGTGYSSLSYLKRLDINEVKIDRCFVDRIQYNAYNLRLLSNIIELAHSAMIDVCCEGIETIEELTAIQGLHTDVLQGFFFAKPYSVDLFEQVYIRPESQAYRERLEKESSIRELEPSVDADLFENLRNEEIGNITESMDELVYVSDVETYELYYLNATGRRMTGVYDYRGCKCYKVLQGRDKPCEFCTNGQLRRDKFVVWEMENTHLKRHFILKDKLIPWKGKASRVEIAFDITEKEILSQSIQKRLNSKRVIVNSCKLLSQEGNTEQSVWNVLKIVGEYCQGERAYILKPGSDGKSWNLSCEWCAEGKNSERFPADLEQAFEESAAERITVPITRNHKVLGMIGVDNPAYREDGEDMLKTISQFLSYSMAAEETKERLQALLNGQNKTPEA